MELSTHRAQEIDRGGFLVKVARIEAAYYLRLIDVCLIAAREVVG